MTDELFNRIVKRLIDDANDVLDDERKAPEDEFVKGEKFAYYLVLDTIKNRLVGEDVDLYACGLNIDLDEKYM